MLLPSDLIRDIITADDVIIVSVTDDNNGGVIVSFYVQNGGDQSSAIPVDVLYEAVKVRETKLLCQATIIWNFSKIKIINIHACISHIGDFSINFIAFLNYTD